MKVFHAAMLLSSSSAITVVLIVGSVFIGIIGVSTDR